MAPPKFADLGKAAKDLLSKDYAAGEVKVELSSKAQNGVEFKKIITQPNGKGTNASAELKYFYAPKNISVTEKWVTANILSQTLSVEKLADGLKVDIDSSYNVEKGNVTTVIKADHTKDKVRTTLDIDALKFVGNASVVVAHEGVLFGVQGAYDTQKGVLTQQNAALAYEAKDFTLTAITDGQKVAASVFHRISPTAQAAVQFNATRGSNETSFVLGGHYALDKDAYIRAKVSQAQEVTVAYTQALRPGVKLTLGMNVDTKTMATDAQKLGLALTINA